MNSCAARLWTKRVDYELRSSDLNPNSKSYIDRVEATAKFRSKWILRDDKSSIRHSSDKIISNKKGFCVCQKKVDQPKESPSTSRSLPHHFVRRRESFIEHNIIKTDIDGNTKDIVLP
jgi:hypothetical protein